MSTNHIKKIVIVLLLVLFIFGCIGVVEIARKNSEGRAPLRSLRITIEKSKREELFDRLSRFAAKHGFEHELTDFNTKGENFQFWMSRDDIKIIANNVPPDPNIVNIRFYDKDPRYPAPEETVDELLNDLKSYISEIPNAIMTEQRKSLQITLDENQREELFAQMRKLAEEHSLDFTLSLSSDKTVFHVEIHGEGFHITSDPVVGSPREISTVFFIDYHRAPTSTSLETVDELSNELKRLLGEIPNVTITEEQQEQ